MLHGPSNTVRARGRGAAASWLHCLPSAGWRLLTAEADALLNELTAVLSEAHAGHEYVTDLSLHGMLEHWDVELVGDCDSFALWCRQALKRRGIASDLVFCTTENGEGHLVCSVAGWILDNRSQWVRRRDDVPYTWLTLGRPDGTWRAITS